MNFQRNRLIVKTAIIEDFEIPSKIGKIVSAQCWQKSFNGTFFLFKQDKIFIEQVYSKRFSSHSVVLVYICWKFKFVTKLKCIDHRK